MRPARRGSVDGPLIEARPSELLELSGAESPRSKGCAVRRLAGNTGAALAASTFTAPIGRGTGSQSSHESPLNGSASLLTAIEKVLASRSCGHPPDDELV